MHSQRNASGASPRWNERGLRMPHTFQGFGSTTILIIIIALAQPVMGDNVSWSLSPPPQLSNEQHSRTSIDAGALKISTLSGGWPQGGGFAFSANLHRKVEALFLPFFVFLPPGTHVFCFPSKVCGSKLRKVRPPANGIFFL